MRSAKPFDAFPDVSNISNGMNKELANMRLKMSLIAVMVMIMALFIGQAVLASQAEQSTQDTIELIGAVQTINADGSIVVNGVTVTITTAQLNVALTPGQIVKVEGTLLSDGRVAAREVQAPQSDDLQDDDEIELVGVVESFDGTTLVVNGLVIDLSGAEINTPIVIGQIIKVHASFDANGNLIARETDDDRDDNDDGSVPPPAVTPEVTPDNNDDDDRPGEFEITGTLEQVGDGFVVVNGQTISISGAEIKNQLVVGTLVKLHLNNQNGQLVAREVENAQAGDDNNDDNGNDDNRPGEFEITGTLEQVGDGFIVVNGQTISITGAEIKNQLVVGTLVKLHLNNQNGQLVAREVENARDDDDDDNDDNSGPGNGDDDTWDEVYTVRPGDTLSSIAARAGVTLEELARINNITDVSVVVTGTRLIVPDSFDDDDDNSGSGSGNSGSGNSDDDDNSGSGSGNSDDSDDNSGSDDNDDNSGSDDNDDNSGSGNSGGDDDDGGSSGGDDDDGGSSGGDDSDDD
jgi:LysM repeat protein/ribosomal protein L13